MSTKKRLPQPWLKGGRTGEVRQAGTITNDLHALEKLLRRIRGDREPTLRVCYEAGTCDFVIADCVVQDREVCALSLVNFDSLCPVGADSVEFDSHDVWFDPLWSGCVQLYMDSVFIS
jgi:hypothetical protein